MKNRFGSTNELGVFEMTGAGLVGVPDPSERLRPHASRARSARRSPARSRGRGRCCSRSRRSSRPPTSRCRGGSATGVDPKRLAMIVAVLARHAGLPLGGGRRLRERRRRRAHRRARRRPRHRARDRLGGARACPCASGLAAFGEIGLTGRLRPATQAERRVEECRKLGLADGPRAGRNGGRDARGGDARDRRSPQRSPRSPSEQGFSRKALQKWRFCRQFWYPVSPSPVEPLWAAGAFATDRRERESACTRSATRWCIPTTGQARS